MIASDDCMDSEEEKKKLNEEFIEFIGKRSETEAPRYTARLKSYADLKRKRERADTARCNYKSRHHYHHEKVVSTSRKKGADEDNKDKALENTEHPGGDKDRMNKNSFKSIAGDTSEGSFRNLQRRASSATSENEDDPFSIESFLQAKLQTCSIREGDKCVPRSRSFSRSRSCEPADRCGGKRRRRRKRSCKRRRRKSCGKRRRRRRKSCGRRRRRKSCGRRRRRSRRRGCSRRRRRRSCGKRRRRRRRCR